MYLDVKFYALSESRFKTTAFESEMNMYDHDNTDFDSYILHKYSYN